MHGSTLPTSRKKERKATIVASEGSSSGYSETIPSSSRHVGGPHMAVFMLLFSLSFDRRPRARKGRRCCSFLGLAYPCAEKGKMLEPQRSLFREDGGGRSSTAKRQPHRTGSSFSDWLELTPTGSKINVLDFHASVPLSDFERETRSTVGAVLLSLSGAALLTIIFGALTVDFANQSEECAIEMAVEKGNDKPIRDLTAVRVFTGLAIGFGIATMAVSGVIGAVLIYQSVRSPKRSQ